MRAHVRFIGALALGASMLAGCYQLHGRGDDLEPGLDGSIGSHDARVPFFDVEPPRADAPCGEVDIPILALRCPRDAARGGTVEVEIDYRPGVCCPSGAGVPTLVEPMGDHVTALHPQWDACGCCAACGCETRTATDRVGLPMPDDGTLMVRADDHRCVIAAR